MDPSKNCGLQVEKFISVKKDLLSHAKFLVIIIISNSPEEETSTLYSLSAVPATHAVPLGDDFLSWSIRFYIFNPTGASSHLKGCWVMSEDRFDCYDQGLVL